MRGQYFVYPLEGGGGGGPVEGEEILSTGISANRYLRANGDDTSSWSSSPAVVYNANTEARVFTNGVGSLTLLYKTIGISGSNLMTIEIPAGTTADGGGQTIVSSQIAVQFRPTADLSFPCFVIDNNVKVLGKVKIGTNGVITFSVGAADGVFTDNATAGWDRITVSYGIS